jgi:hypothetical protein
MAFLVLYIFLVLVGGMFLPIINNINKKYRGENAHVYKPELP